MPHYYLFSTSGCHLCEQAERVLLSQPAPIDYQIKEISENEVWMQRYAIRIPVLYHLDSGDELNWPFDQQSLLEFIQPHSFESSP